MCSGTHLPCQIEVIVLGNKLKENKNTTPKEANPNGKNR